MSASEIDFAELVALLRRRADNPAVVGFIERDATQIERSDYYGYVGFVDRGISVMFKEAAFLLAPSEIVDPKALYLAAFHLHRAGHEGYRQYTGGLPHDVRLDDSTADVTRKAGVPSEAGGGGMSRVLRKPIPRWLRYRVGDATLQYQLDDADRVEMATLYTPSLAGL